MIADPPVLSIRREFDRVGPQELARFIGAETVHIVDAMDGHGALDYRIKPLDRGSASLALPSPAMPERTTTSPFWPHSPWRDQVM